MSQIDRQEITPVSFDLFTPEKFRNLEFRPLQKETTVALMLDMDKSYLGDLDTKNLNEMIRVRKHFNWFLGKRAKRGDSHLQGLDIIPVITTQRPWAAFIGNNAKPAFREALNIWQKRIQAQASWYSIPMTLVLAEFGAIALTQNGKGDWKTRENIGLSQGLKLKRDVAVLKSWLVKLGYAPEDSRYLGVCETKFEEGNEFYVSLQEPDGSAMKQAKKIRISKEVTTELKRHEEGRTALKKFKVDISQRDIDFLSIYEEEGKLLALDLLIQFFNHSGYPWFGPENIIAVDDQFSSAGPLFREILNYGGRVVTVANADEELKELCLNHKKAKNAYVSPLEGHFGVMEGLYDAFDKKHRTEHSKESVLEEIRKVNSFNLQNLLPVKKTGQV